MKLKKNCKKNNLNKLMDLRIMKLVITDELKIQKREEF